jgi:hypothetical protein
LQWMLGVNYSTSHQLMKTSLILNHSARWDAFGSGQAVAKQRQRPH